MTVDRVLAELASVRRRLLAELEGFDAAAFARLPPGGGWSAAQVTEHVARVEGGIVRAARRAVEHGSAVRPGPFDALRKLPLKSGLVQWVRMRTVRGADPALDMAEPPGIAASLARLEQVRGESMGFLEEVRGRDLSRVYLRHPFFGAFPVLEMLGWAAWHEERHRHQVVRLRRAFGLR